MPLPDGIGGGGGGGGGGGAGGADIFLVLNFYFIFNFFEVISRVRHCSETRDTFCSCFLS